MNSLEKFIETLPENEQELIFHEVDAWKSALEREKCHVQANKTAMRWASHAG